MTETTENEESKTIDIKGFVKKHGIEGPKAIAVEKLLEKSLIKMSEFSDTTLKVDEKNRSEGGFFKQINNAFSSIKDIVKSGSGLAGAIKELRDELEERVGKEKTDVIIKEINENFSEYLKELNKTKKASEGRSR